MSPLYNSSKHIAHVPFLTITTRGNIAMAELDAGRLCDKVDACTFLVDVDVGTISEVEDDRVTRADIDVCTIFLVIRVDDDMGTAPRVDIDVCTTLGVMTFEVCMFDVDDDTIVDVVGAALFIVE